MSENRNPLNDESDDDVEGNPRKRLRMAGGYRQRTPPLRGEEGRDDDTAAVPMIQGIGIADESDGAEESDDDDSHVNIIQDIGAADEEDHAAESDDDDSHVNIIHVGDEVVAAVVEVDEDDDCSFVEFVMDVTGGSADI